MTLSALKAALASCEELHLILPDGTAVPSHFHITEVGLIDKHFIDCGGKTRHEQRISLQLWVSNDTWHRLTPKRWSEILQMSSNHVDLANHLIEVEYQGRTTIEKYGLTYSDGRFNLTTLKTACLAEDLCLRTDEMVEVDPSGKAVTSTCTPGAGCC